MARTTDATVHTDSFNAIESNEAPVSITISGADYAVLARVFGTSGLNQVAADIAQSAFDEWIGWLSGRKRFTSMTDQTIERVVTIYARVSPDVEPEVGSLYNKFNIPFGSARYIAQAIASRQLSDFNDRALGRLITALEEQANILSTLSEIERKVLQEIRIAIDARAEKMLTTIVELLPITQRRSLSIRPSPSWLSNTREYSLSPRDLQSLLEAVKNFRR